MSVTPQGQFPWYIPITQIKFVPHPDTVRVDFHLEHDTTWYPGRGGKKPFGDGVTGILCYNSKHPSGRLEVQAATWREAIDKAIEMEKK